MAEEARASDTPAVDDPRSPAEPSQPTSTVRAADEPMSLEEARKLRRENNELNKRLKAAEDAKLSDLDRLQRDLDARTKERDSAAYELRTLRAESALFNAGAIRPKLLAHELPEEAFEDAATLKKAVAELRKAYPELFRSPNGSADGAAASPADVGESVNDRLRLAMGARSRRG